MRLYSEKKNDLQGCIEHHCFNIQRHLMDINEKNGMIETRICFSRDFLHSHIMKLGRKENVLSFGQICISVLTLRKLNI